MSAVSTLFLLLAGTALQALLPVFGWLSNTSVPILAGVVVYYALFRGPGISLAVALFAGLFQDSLSLMPIGYSSFCFAACAFLIHKFREVMMVQSVLTHMVLVAAVQGAVTAFLSVLLVKDGLIPWRPWWLLLKLPAAMVLGLVTGPLVIAAARALEEKLGLIEGNNDSYGAQPTYYGLG